MNLVSIIVPVYNVEKHLNICVDSLLNQTYKNIEILLVDDGSTDGSGILCDELAKTDIRIKVIHKLNGGVSSARNIGLKQASGKYIGFVDSDDWVEHDMYEKLVTTLESNSAQLVSCNMDAYYKKCKTNYSKESEYSVEEIKNPYFDILTNSKIAGYVNNKLYIRQLIKTKYDEQIAQNEDMLFVSQYLNSVSKMVNVNKKLYHYQIHDLKPDVSLNSRIMTLPSAYKKIFEVYKANAPDYVWLLDKNLLKVYLNLKGRYKLLKHRDDKLLASINDGIKKYYKKVLSCDSVTIKERLNIRFSKMFPKMMLLLKIKRLTALHKKGIWME